MKTYLIYAHPKDRPLAPGLPADYCDEYEAENETEARKIWDAENDELCGGALEITKVEECQP